MRGPGRADARRVCCIRQAARARSTTTSTTGGGVLYGSSAAASPMPLQRLLEPNKQTAARQPHPAHLGAGHLRHNACQRLTLLSCHQVQGIQELQQAFECARSRLHYCKVQGQASAPCSPWVSRPPTSPTLPQHSCTYSLIPTPHTSSCYAPARLLKVDLARRPLLHLQRGGHTWGTQGAHMVSGSGLCHSTLPWRLIVCGAAGLQGSIACR